jgi:hypothetical protein
VSAKLEEVALIKKEETGSQDMRELPKNLEKEMESILMIKEEKVKLDHRKESPKVNDYAIDLVISIGGKKAKFWQLFIHLLQLWFFISVVAHLFCYIVTLDFSNEQG